nr:UV-B-induced protein At3g17800, chloroplastic-like [Ipomoea trifida]
MDCGLSSSFLNSSPFAGKSVLAPTPAAAFRFGFPNSRVGGSGIGWRRAVVVAASGGRASRSQCEFSGLNAPLEPTTPSGRFLSTVFQNDREYFPLAVEKQLEQLAYDRDEAAARMTLSLASDEACLHRRIAELRAMDCRAAVEDVMYMLILYKFSEIRVRLVPRLSKCIYNGRLEICPSRDWELESIHSLEVLDMVKEHLTTVVGWRANSKVTDNWAPTQVQRLHLCRVYAASILYGYFLKSASLRHHLEQSLDDGLSHLSTRVCPLGSKNVAFSQGGGMQPLLTGPISFVQGEKQETLKSYVMGFDPETLQMCAKPKSKSAMNLIERQSSALFGDEGSGLLESNEVISTSLASLKRIVLEAIAFGSFLWDTEEYVNNIYDLEAN